MPRTQRSATQTKRCSPSPPQSRRRGHLHNQRHECPHQVRALNIHPLHHSLVMHFPLRSASRAGRRIVHENHTTDPPPLPRLRRLPEFVMPSVTSSGNLGLDACRSCGLCVDLVSSEAVRIQRAIQEMPFSAYRRVIELLIPWSAPVMRTAFEG